MIQMAEHAVEKGFKKTKVEGAAWTAFLMTQLEKLLYIPLRKNGQPKKKWLDYE